jgi:superfamily II DNA or RNA helicase
VCRVGPEKAEDMEQMTLEPCQSELQASQGGDDPDWLWPHQSAALARLRPRLALGGGIMAAVEMATGCGKSSIFSCLTKSWPGRVLVLVHREELLTQTKATLERITGESVEIEKAKFQAGHCRIVVGMIQTIGRLKRLARFDKDHFSLVIIDEVHHFSKGSGYERVANYFAQAPLAGFTATLDRSDKKPVLRTPEDLVYRFTTIQAMEAGVLCPLEIKTVYVGSIDLSQVKSSLTENGRDLNPAEYDAVISTEENLHAIAFPLLRNKDGSLGGLVGDLKTLVFHGPTVASARRLTEVMNRYQPGCAKLVSAQTEPHERRQMFAEFGKKFQILVNVGIATEAYDCPDLECVVLARMTESRSLHAQMLGRVLRIHPGKTIARAIDFVGNSGKHELVTSLDALMGDNEDQAIKAAVKKALQASPEALEFKKAIADAKKQQRLEFEAQQATRDAMEKRAMVVAAQGQWRVETQNPFTRLMLPAPTFNRDLRLANKEQCGVLERNGMMPPVAGWTFEQAELLVNAITHRTREGLTSWKQLNLLAKYGVNAEHMTRAMGNVLITRLNANRAAGYGYRFRPGEAQALMEGA